MVVEPVKNKQKIQEFLTYLKGVRRRDWLLAKFQLNTGLRISDVIDISYEDLFDDTGAFKSYFTIKEQKTSKHKRIKLNDEIKKAILEYIPEVNFEENQYLFQSKKGGHIERIQAWRVFKDGANAVGIENFGTHSLRKTWGYWTYKASRYNIGLIMDTFNHSSPKITLRYIGISQEEKDELYSLVKF